MAWADWVERLERILEADQVVARRWNPDAPPTETVIDGDLEDLVNEIRAEHENEEDWSPEVLAVREG